MEYYKYIHVLFQNEMNWSSIILDYFSEDKEFLNGKDHFFITPHKEVYDEFKSNKNIIFWEKGKYCHEIINYYGDRTGYFFVHHIRSLGDGIRIKRKYRSKVIWRTWGGSNFLEIDRKITYTNVKKILANMYWRLVVKQFCAIGIANLVDEIDIKNKFGNVKTFIMPYYRKGKYEAIKNVKNKVVEENATINVLIGHSGYREDNHVEIINLCNRFKNENVKFYIILSYGDPDYMKIVEKKGKDVLGDNVIFVKEYMELEKYTEFLNSMDIGIFDGECSYALGNISIMLFYNKKIFLNKNGIIAHAFEKENLSFSTTEQLSSMTFEQFVDLKNEDNKLVNTSLKPLNEKMSDNFWKEIFKYLTNI